MDIKVNLAALNSVYSGLDPPQQQPATDPSGETESHPLAPAAVEQAARGNAARARAEAASTTGAPVEPEASDDESGTARKKRRKSGTGGTRGSKKGAKADEAAAATAAGTSATSEEDGRSDQRFKWTAQLHQLFLASIFEIGLAASSPKKIHDQMRSDPKLARELLGDEIARRLLDGGSEGDIGAHHVKSHLQRYVSDAAAAAAAAAGRRRDRQPTDHACSGPM
jgi:SHAQKYF class myb-like DNA-binding protein